MIFDQGYMKSYFIHINISFYIFNIHIAFILWAPQGRLCDFIPFFVCNFLTFTK